MDARITPADLQVSLTEILERVRSKGERFVIERDGKPLAVLGPAWPQPGVTFGEIADRIGHLTVPEGFGDDLEAIQAEQPKEVAPEWPS